MDITINKAQKAKPDPIGDYTTPIARTGEQQFACIMRNRSGVSSGEIDFGARFIDRLCDGDQQSAVNSAFAIYEKWCRETGKRAPRDKSEALEKDFAYHAELCTSQQARIATQQARIEALEAERRWMPFEKPEQLPQTMWAPNYSDPILVAILSGKTRFVRDDRYDFVQDRWDSGCVGVTHWMPLPEPPEAEK